MDMLEVLTVDFDTETLQYEAEIEFLEGKDGNFLEGLHKTIGCDWIDIVPYSEDYSVVIDDEGLLVSNNIVHEIALENGNRNGTVFEENTLQLAGKLIFVRNKITDEGVEIDSLKKSDTYYLMKTLKIKPIGITR